MSKTIKERCCPYCKSTKGFYDLSLEYVGVAFDFYGNQIDYGFYSDYSKQLKRKYCIDCDKVIPKKMIKEILGETDNE